MTQFDTNASHEAELDSLMAEIKRSVNGEPPQEQPAVPSDFAADAATVPDVPDVQADPITQEETPVVQDIPSIPMQVQQALPEQPQPAAMAQPAPVATGPTWEPEQEGRHRRWPTVVLALLVLLAAAYLAGTVVFMGRFMPNTTLNGTDVSLKTVGEVAQLNAASADDFSFDVKGDGIDLHLSAADIKASYDGGAYARAAIAKQKAWLWPLQALSHREIEVESRLSYDAARLEDKVGSAVDALNKEAQAPVDASVEFDKDGKRYVIKPEVLGTEVKKAEAVSQVRDALNAGQESVELGDDLLLKPEVLSTDERLTTAVETANSYLDATQDLVTHGETVATVGEEELQSWVSLSDDLTVSFDEEACTKWAQGDLSKKLDSYGSTRSYTRPDGKKVTVSGGTYGWIIDGADIAARIADNVREGKAGTVEVSFKQEASVWKPGAQDWGDRFIDVDLSEQHVRFYDGSNIIWETDCVSGGLDSKGEMHSTPTGVYAINSNMRSGNVKLTGKIDPKTKEPEYISYVDYWMPFIGDSVALHDADWRSSFGGSIYLSNGSHGCVNLPVDKAKELYGMVGVGTVVVVHE